jgi:hypothetical protein
MSDYVKKINDMFSWTDANASAQWKKWFLATPKAPRALLKFLKSLQVVNNQVDPSFKEIAKIDIPRLGMASIGSYKGLKSCGLGRHGTLGPKGGKCWRLGIVAGGLLISDGKYYDKEGDVKAQIKTVEEWIKKLAS